MEWLVKWRGGNYARQKEAGIMPQSTSLTTNFTWARLMEPGRLARCPTSKLGWTIRASPRVSRENPPTSVCSNPQQGTKWKSTIINLKHGHKGTERKTLLLMISVSKEKGLPSLSLSSRSLYMRAHFVFSPIRIHQQSILLHTQREH